MSKLRILSAIALLAAFGAAANAETVILEGITPGSADGRPSRGMTQTGVESRYGSPVAVESPVGEPPITRWEYADFVVFFEHDKVIHAIVKR